MSAYKFLLHEGSGLKIFNILSKRKIAITARLDGKIYKFPRLVCDQVLENPGQGLTFDDELLNSLKGKMTYNSLASMKNVTRRWRVREVELRKLNKIREQPAVPISLQYKYGDSVFDFDEYRTAIRGEDDVFRDDTESNDTNEDNVNLPYSIAKKVDIQPDTSVSKNSEEPMEAQEPIDRRQDVDPLPRIGKRWMSDYEVYEEEEESDTVEYPNAFYGTPDPNILPSKIPCGGCGALLHCQNPSIPGYLPKEIFLPSNDTDLKLSVCQRCTFLKNYNVALSVSVDTDSYPKLLASLKNKKALIVLLVDMTDFPCSIWPKMLDIIGHEKPIILVGNKTDLIPGDFPGWLNYAKEVLRRSLPHHANILDTFLISAKTGFCVEDLITKLFITWQTRGDVYLVGCTNVGKSSLFNDLIRSDYCKSQAADLIQRATVSPWPGTTLNLLKFPIMRLSDWRAFLRLNRIKSESRAIQQERNLEKLQAKESKTRYSRLPQIIGRIGRTFNAEKSEVDCDKVIDEEFVMPKVTNKFLQTDDRKVFNPDTDELKLSKWCYDTPGVVHPDQIINLLTTEELSKTLATSTMYARFYSIYVGQTLFIAGLARIDLVQSEHPMCRFNIYASDKLPITICKTENADEVYNTLLGTVYMGVPCGSLKRLQQWPRLKSTKDYEITGEGHARCGSEIVLSSAGWASFTCVMGKKFTVRPWTPEGRGIHFREMPLLRYTPLQRKSRISSTPTYYQSRF